MTFLGLYHFHVLFTAKSWVYSKSFVLRMFSWRAAWQKSHRASSGIWCPTGHTPIELFSLVFHYTELLWWLFPGHPAGTSEEEKHNTAPSKTHLTSPMAPAQALGVSFCCLVLFAVSASAGIKNCPIKAGFAELPGGSWWPMAVLLPGQAFPWDLL